MRRVVMFSGGVGSWAAAKRVAERYGMRDLVLLFTDTCYEDPDLYRFLDEAVLNVGGELVRIADGRTPWEVYHDERFLGNSRADPCSKILKRELADRWLRENCDPANTVVNVGIDWSEEHRFTRLAALREQQGWRYEAPLCEAPYLTKGGMFGLLRSEGIQVPQLYGLGFQHNNCRAWCCKAGQGHFVNLLSVRPEWYAEYEANEQELRRYLNRDDIAVLLDRRGGQARPMTLRELRGRVQAGEQMDMFDIGGCGCFVDVAAA